ncbi:hypothetical protein B5F17_00055 [Butyricicoccus pullicaecorum]|uniref:Transporter n=1 Tax=Butyricicoccus pullicaecorum TaxID=501571 RepID=A0A1Y4LC78_9FIRM|nr:hypothetical protein [Butyricicoccus pullicaecorum]OUP54326.1 hypothetical protein B5F17_00055 [Butyricicoccus pullicaecorum]
MVTLTSLHIAYIVITVAVLAALLLKKEIVLPCALGILIIGYLYKGSLIGAVQTLNNAIIHSCVELLSIIVVIALVVAMSHAMIAVGADQMLMRPVGRIIRTRNTAFWAIGLAMLIVSWLIWPSPAVALIGALLLPVASRVGLPAIWAAVAMNLFGHGAGLSSDFFIQGAPDITATAAGVDTVTVMRASLPLWAVMCITTFAVAFFLMHRDLKQNPSLATVELHDFSRTIERPRLAITIAVLIPAALLFDVGLMVRFGITGGDATALVAGTALILMSITTITDHGVRNALEIATDHLRDGFIFAIKIFAPVIVIAGFFFLGSESFAQTVLGPDARGLLSDIGLWLAEHVPLSRASIAVLETAVGAITGLDGSGFSGLPLCGALAQTFAATGSVDVATLAALGQISTVWVGGGTIIPWGCVPVAAICGIKAADLAKKNLIPVVCGLAATTIAAIILM